MRQATELSEEQGWPISDAEFAKIVASQDAHEGAVAFAEKREPNWQGK
jgi:enoyl-CoA hydratase